MTKKILVIEDEADLRANVARFLKAEGYEVLAAANGASGVETAIAQSHATREQSAND